MSPAVIMSASTLTIFLGISHRFYGMRAVYVQLHEIRLHFPKGHSDIKTKGFNLISKSDLNSSVGKTAFITLISTYTSLQPSNSKVIFSGLMV